MQKKELEHVSKNRDYKIDLIIAVCLLIAGIAARLAPHPANFAPLAAIAIFGGLYLPKKLAVALPLASLFIGDAVIGFYSWKIMITVYAGFALTAYAAAHIRHSFGSIVAVTLGGSILFFLATNAAVWAFGTMYTHDLAGLIQSYTMAIPFFRNSLLGDLFYTGVFVGIYRLVAYLAKNRLHVIPVPMLHRDKLQRESGIY